MERVVVGLVRRAVVGVRFLPQDLVLRVLHLQAVRRQLELAEENDALVRWKTSLRNGWLNQTARSDPVASRTSISKILNRGRRVGRIAAAHHLGDDRRGRRRA